MNSSMRSMTGMLSPFVYQGTPPDDDVEARENDADSERRPLLISSPNHLSLAPPSPASDTHLRRELFGQLAGEDSINFGRSGASSKRREKGRRCFQMIRASVTASFTAMTAVRSPHEQCLDGFRALAFLWVLSFHVGTSFKEVSTEEEWRNIGWLYQDLDAWHVALNGDMGVRNCIYV